MAPPFSSVPQAAKIPETPRLSVLTGQQEEKGPPAVPKEAREGAGGLVRHRQISCSAEGHSGNKQTGALLRTAHLGYTCGLHTDGAPTAQLERGWLSELGRGWAG